MNRSPRIPTTPYSKAKMPEKVIREPTPRPIYATCQRLIYANGELHQCGEPKKADRQPYCKACEAKTAPLPASRYPTRASQRFA